MRYAIAYDVPEDGTRIRVARILEGYGWRVQFSVFECDLEPADLERLVRRLRRTLGKSGRGNVRIYRLCADCHRASIGLGAVERGLDDRVAIMV